MNILVSIILPVFNGEKFLARSIFSLLSQTYHNFELIIINDGSNDNSEIIIKSYNDPRIRYYSQNNIGLAKTLNRGIGLSKGKYIARQDQDDFSELNRIESQLNYLEFNNDIALVGTAATIWVEGKKSKRKLSHPCTNSEIKIGLLFYNYFVHSSVMIRKEVIIALGGYTESSNRQPPEDYELWSRMSHNFNLANLPELLVNYTEVNSSMSRVTYRPFVDKSISFSLENLLWALDINQISPAMIALANIMHRNYNGIPKSISFSELNLLLHHAILNVERKYKLNPDEVRKENIKLKNKLKIFYIDYLFNGILSRVHEFLKSIKS